MRAGGKSSPLPTDLPINTALDTVDFLQGHNSVINPDTCPYADLNPNLWVDSPEL